MQAFRDLAKVEDPMPPPDVHYHPSSLSVSLVADCAYAASVIAHACISQGLHIVLFFVSLPNFFAVNVEMDAVRYSERLNRLCDRVVNDDVQLHQFGHDTERAIQLDLPSVITDKFGVVLLWYLPNILSPQRQVRLHVVYLLFRH